MRYTVTDDFIKVNETTGIIQNTSQVYTLEVSTIETAGSGLLVYPLKSFSFRGFPVYMRCTDPKGVITVNVAPFTFGTSGGGSSSADTSYQTFDQQDLNDIFKD